MAIVSMMAIELTPRFRRKFRICKLIPIPGALLAILCAFTIEFAIVRPTGSKTPLVQDKSHLDKEGVIPLPYFMNKTITKLKWDKNCWLKILHQGYMLAAIGTVESMLTMKIVDANTGTLGWGNRQEFAVGFANVVAGFLGGMGGTAMIGLSTIVSGWVGADYFRFCACFIHGTDVLTSLDSYASYQQLVHAVYVKW